MMVIVQFEKDAVGVLHQHFHSQITYVAEGKFEVTANAGATLSGNICNCF